MLKLKETGGVVGPSSEVKVGTNYRWDRWCTNKECTDLSEPRLTDGSGNKFTTVQGAIDSGATDIDLESRTYDGFKILSPTEINGTGSTKISETITTYTDTSGGYAIYLTDLTLDTSSDTAYATGTDTMMKNVTITSNNNRFLNIYDSWENVAINNSKILEESVNFDYNANVHAKYNWWGSSDGPPQSVKDNNDYSWDPYCTVKDCSSYSD